MHLPSKESVHRDNYISTKLPDIATSGKCGPSTIATLSTRKQTNQHQEQTEDGSIPHICGGIIVRFPSFMGTPGHTILPRCRPLLDWGWLGFSSPYIRGQWTLHPKNHFAFVFLLYTFLSVSQDNVATPSQFHWVCFAHGPGYFHCCSCFHHFWL